VWFGYEHVTPAMLQRGEYGARVGVPRLLQMLERHELPATFFIPGHPLESFPEPSEAVLEAGHWLGLHFDASEISSDADVVTGVERDARRLEALFGHAVTAVSFHMPGRRTVGGIELPDGLVNVYGPRFFEEIAYVSDSNQDWRGTDVEALFAGRAVNRLQLLTHPFWWRESYGTIGEKLEELAAELGVAVEEIATWEQVELIRRGAA